MNWHPFIERHDWHERSQGAIAVYENGECIAEKRLYHSDNNVDFRLAIKRFDKKPIHRWSDFQRIKNEIAGPERVALEVYPASTFTTNGIRPVSQSFAVRREIRSFLPTRLV